uniref:Uncharacterized protein n=1 Tax=Triticum urartu TaxID=4572 RepID=A0A8R7TV18_TRIUA
TSRRNCGFAAPPSSPAAAPGDIPLRRSSALQGPRVSLVAHATLSTRSTPLTPSSLASRGARCSTMQRLTRGLWGHGPVLKERRKMREREGRRGGRRREER